MTTLDPPQRAVLAFREAMRAKVNVQIKKELL